MIYLKKVSTTKPVSGNIINSKNITDKEKNTYSANIIDTLLSEVGISETVIQTIINTAKLAAHPIGSYYWSDDPTDPSELFGGTWEHVKDKFLYALGDEGNAGDEGGASSVTLTTNELPAHTHGLANGNVLTNNYGTNDINIAAGSGSYARTAYGGTGSTGKGQSFSIMPPYVKAYCWKRVS